MIDSSVTDDEEDRLKIEMSELHKELNDILQLNYDIVAENRNKDLTIARLRDFSHKMLEKNESELDQLKLEDDYFAEEFELEILVEERMVKNLKIELEKLFFIENKNVNMKSTIDSTNTVLSNQSWSYANTIHDINAGIRDYREEIEQTLKKELLRIKSQYQNTAFSCLDKMKKVSLLKLAKLQDEIVLQEHGKSSLEIRHKKQVQEFIDYTVQHAIMCTSLQENKSRLNELYTTRQRLCALVAKAASHEETITRAKEEFNAALQQRYPNTDDVYRKLFDVNISIKGNRESLHFWNFVLNGLRDLISTIRVGEDAFGIDACVKSWNDNLSTGDLNTTVLTILKRIYEIPDLYEILISVTGADRYNHILETIETRLAKNSTYDCFKDIMFDATLMWAIFHIINIWDSGLSYVNQMSCQTINNQDTYLHAESLYNDSFTQQCLEVAQGIRSELLSLQDAIM